MTLPYRAYPLLRSGHIQTFLAGLENKNAKSGPTQPIFVACEADERLVVHEEIDPTLTDSAKVIILIHGLSGDHTSPYMVRMAAKLHGRGNRIWRVDLRGCGLGLKYAWRPPHAGRSEDLAAIVAKARHLYPQAPVALAGVSLGGNILLKFLGELAAGELPIRLEESGIQHAMAIVPPLDLHDCIDNMDRLRRRLYNMYYVQALVQQANERRKLWPQWSELPMTPRIKTIRQFDSRFTAPLSGFRDADDYYTRASCLGWLPEIRTPTEIVLDRHDPICTWHSFAKAKFDPKWVSFTHTDYGGHMGFLGVNEKGKAFRWIDYYVAEKFQQNTT